jgi:sigma-B regulation protein RsbQ
VAPAFEGDYRVVLFDYTGCGRSNLAEYDADKYSSLEGYAADILDICLALDLHDVTIVGHSVSATIAMLAALECPEIFSSLVMVTPSMRYVNCDGYTGGFEHKDIDEIIAMMDVDYSAWATVMAPVIMGYPQRPALGQELADCMIDMEPEIARRFARLAFLTDYRDRLVELEVPTLILQSSDDALVPKEAARYIHEHLPNSTYRVLRAAGHCPHMSEPREVIREIRRYLGTTALQNF